jgi:hypothetical protein
VARITSLTCAWQRLAAPRVDLAVPERQAQRCSTRYRKEFPNMTAVTPLTTRPFDDSTDSLLRFAIRLDATLAGAVGLFIALMADPLSALTGLSSVTPFTGGALLVLAGLAVYALAAAPDLRRVGRGLIVGNVVMAVATIVVVAAGVLPLTEAGVAATVAMGGYFALMGYLQYLGVRRLPA